METIVAAVISALASAVAALVAEARPAPPLRSARSARVWGEATALLVAWLVLSPILIHREIVALNVPVIFAATVALAAIAPIRPLVAVSAVLVLHPVNLFLEPLGALARGLGPDTRLDARGALPLLGVIALDAIVVGAICRWRGRAGAEARPLSRRAWPWRRPRARDTRSPGHAPRGVPPTAHGAR